MAGGSSSGELLAWAEHKLSSNNISTAHLDALVLLEDVTKVDRAHLLSEPTLPITQSQRLRYLRLVKLRQKQLPLAYIRGKTEFYGHEFKLNRYVLEPRPESEALIEEFDRITNNEPGIQTLVDIGTGSGALVISAKIEHPKLNAIAVDIDPKCLRVAEHNALNLGVEISFYCGNLISPIPKSIWSEHEVIIANLPYVPDSWQINPAAAHEPAKAIFGGPDGLTLYRDLFKQLGNLDFSPEWVLTESLPPQHKTLSGIAAKQNYKLYLSNDFVQVFRKQ